MTVKPVLKSPPSTYEYFQEIASVSPNSGCLRPVRLHVESQATFTIIPTLVAIQLNPG